MKKQRILRLMMLFFAGTASTTGVAQSSVDGHQTGIARIAAEHSTSTPATDAISNDLSFLCKFTSGPQTGRIEDLAGRSGAAAIPVGGRCSDGPSSGISVIATSGDKESLTWNGAITDRTTNRRTSTICQFMSGPKAHGWHDFAPFPPAPVDSICDDGAGSVGVVQPSGHGDRY